MDFGFANCMLVLGLKVRNDTPFQRALAEALGMNRRSILVFGNRDPLSPWITTGMESPPNFNSSAHPRRISQSSEKTLDAPDLVDDYNLNLLDWSATNVIAIGLGNSVYLYDVNNRKTVELLSTDDDDRGLVTSLKWAPDGTSLVVSFNNSKVQLWDSHSHRLLRNLPKVHRSRVGSLDWNENNILTTGGRDGLIVNHDLRMRSDDVRIFRGHRKDVCALKWSKSGEQLASGGADNRLNVWDISTGQRLHRFSGHTSAVKALSWSPFERNLLASGSVEDQFIKFWNSSTGACLNTVDAGCSVTSLLWNSHESELLSSHGTEKNELVLWNYPSMIKLAKLEGHTARILHTTQSPDGCTVASTAADERLMFWNVFGSPKQAKHARKPRTEPFSAFPRIR